MKLKHCLIAITLAVLASPALALEVGPPFEQNELDRTLPDIQFAPVAPYVADARAPYEQLVIDRMLPNLPSRNVQYAARDTGTRTDAYSHVETSSPWANDWYFIAPPL